MPIWMVCLGERREAWEKASELGFLGCLESVDAALWLIAGGRHAQALVQLQSAVEVALNTFLDRIDPSLVAESGEAGSVRTITFMKAVGRVADRCSWVGGWRERLGDLHDQRNKVAHRGSNGEQQGKHVECIATVAVPFLDAFLGEETHGISLEKAVTPDIYKELGVAREVCERLRQESRPVRPYVLKTVSLAVAYANVDWPKPELWPGMSSSRDDDFELGLQTRDELPAAWGDSVIEGHHCAICGSVNLFVHVRHVAEPERRLIPLAARCPKCGLDIADEDSFLGEHHVLPFPPDVVAGFFKDLPR